MYEVNPWWMASIDLHFPILLQPETKGLLRVFGFLDNGNLVVREDGQHVHETEI
jgi:hypothetical protein